MRPRERTTTGTYSPDRRHGGGEVRRWHWQCTSDAAYRRSLPASRSEFATATASAAHDATRTRDRVRQPRVVASREPRATFNSYHNSLPPVMDEIFSTVHETLQDSLDIVNTAQLFQLLTHSPSYRSYQCVRPPRHAREHWKVWSV